MAHQNVLHGVLLEQRVIDRQNRAAGIAENRIDALVLEGFDDYFRTGHLFRHRLLRSVWSGVQDNKKGPLGGLIMRQLRENGVRPVPCLAHRLLR